MIDVSLEQRVRERAYAIWEEAGRVPGGEGDHWLRAEREVLEAVLGDRPAAAPKRRPTRASLVKRSAKAA